VFLRPAIQEITPPDIRDNIRNKSITG